MDESHTRSAANTQFHVARFLSCTLIFDLHVCMTSVVEWSKALVAPGSHPATWKIIYFFFLFLSMYLYFLSRFRNISRYSVAFVFWETAFKALDRFFTRTPSWISTIDRLSTFPFHCPQRVCIFCLPYLATCS